MAPLTLRAFYPVLALCATQTATGQTLSEARPAESADDYYQQAVPIPYFEQHRYYKGYAYFLLDRDGNLVGRQPVGVDEDDIIVVLIAFQDVSDGYEVEVIGGEYKPDDLRIIGEIGKANYTPSSTTEKVKPLWRHLRFEFGPYTSEKVVINIKSVGKTLASYSITINDLYHVSIGGSFVKSWLEDPVYKLTPLNDSTKTISATEGGPRLVATATCTWFWWPTLRRWFSGDNVTRGRDALKEPNFLERFNPTFGVGLSEKVFENYFVGASFEFARGGSLYGGMHFAKTTRLVDRNFDPGHSIFTGEQTDIITERVLTNALFIGITLDSRIIAALQGE